MKTHSNFPSPEGLQCINFGCLLLLVAIISQSREVQATPHFSVDTPADSRGSSASTESSIRDSDQEDVANDTPPDKNLLKNPELKWNGEELTAWEISQGAGNGPRHSVIRKGGDSSLEISGDSTTQTWNFVGQTVPVTAGDYLQLSYVAKASNLKREAGQHDNCWAAVWYYRNGHEVGREFFTVPEGQYASHQHVLHAPRNSTDLKVMFFLSKTGTLNIRDVGLRLLHPMDSFDVLVRQMDRHYSYFQIKEIDWDGLTEKYRQQALDTEDVDAFADVILDMLAELKDGHTWIERNGRRESKFRQAWKANFDFRVVNADLQEVKSIRGVGRVARTSDGLGYIRVAGLTADPAAMQELIGEVDDLFDTPGIIVDLRMNRGGNEDLGLMLASVFCNEPVVYARNRFRINDNHDEFVEYPRSPVRPRDGQTYTNPVVCLIGPGAVSSAEGMALMFDALPNVTTMGQPTRGSSGNPHPVKLPNGLDVWFSRWVALDGEGEPIEGRGVQPDILVEHGEGDPAWEQARSRLGK